MDRLNLPRSCFAERAGALAREWLVTNGLGGFAAGTVAQAHTRRYHGLLVAALRPPLERVVMVSKVDAVASYRGSRFELSANEYGDGTLAPRGFELLGDFHLDGLTPVWSYALTDALLVQRVWMDQGRNTTRLSYTLQQASAPLRLQLTPLCTYRDYHAHGRASAGPAVGATSQGCEITWFEGARSYRLAVDRGGFHADQDWHWNFHHSLESERGLDANEDLLRPGVFGVELQPGDTVTLTMTAEREACEASEPSRAHEQLRQGRLAAQLQGGAPQWVRQLTLAADQFIVARSDDAGVLAGKTVIAGYPWFGDWGRDTMIALPGLALATGRFAEAAAILRTFAAHVSQGMLPNRFPDGNQPPEYNTADATLWYFHAIAQYLQYHDDPQLLAELYPVLRDIVDWHLRGTRYGLRVDARDGLLHAGEPGVQLTWMDAKVGDWVVTPRIGKPVEINALWHYALTRMAGWATRQRDASGAAHYAAAAARVAGSFADAFWSDGHGHLYDVIDTPEGSADASLRPNQLFAVSLGTGLLSPTRQRAVVETCANALFTPVGLRSLSPGHHSYVSRYRGGPVERDGAYHQGTVWSWLLGPYALAHYRVYGDADAAQALLAGIAPHLADGCMGSISEIFDADAPHAPRGCFAQAWSVAEVLRAWHLLESTRLPQTLSKVNRG
jgi:predicted glycogen debranching enzyme